MPLASWPVAVNHQTGALEYSSSLSSSGGAGTVLAYKLYSLAADATTTSSTFADINAANMVVTFTAPSSGNVRVELEAAAAAGLNTSYSWGLRDSGGNVAGAVTFVQYNSPNPVLQTRATIVMTGLTSGASYTWKWSHAVTFGSASSKTAAGTTLMVVSSLP